MIMLFFHLTPLHPNASTQFFRFTKPPMSNERITTSPYALLKAARYAKNYYFKGRTPRERKLTHSALFENNLISQYETQKTLAFLIKTIVADHSQKKDQFRVNDPAFLKKHFSFIKWDGDKQTAKKNKVFVSNNKIRLTHYAVFSCNGSDKKTKQHPYPLYQITSDTFDEKHRTKYSKQKILSGLLEQERFAKHVKPLIWLSRHNVEQALMQGSIIVTTPYGKKRLFNVSRSNVSDSNNFAYDRRIKNSWKQKLYWYFKEIRQNAGWHNRKHRELVSLGGAVFAGDVENIGLGKVIALRYKNVLTGKNEIKLGVLADRGSAFSNNLYQLDLFEGIFDTRKQFDTHIRRYPDTVEAYILKKRTKKEYHGKKNVARSRRSINHPVRKLRPTGRQRNQKTRKRT